VELVSSTTHPGGPLVPHYWCPTRANVVSVRRQHVKLDTGHLIVTPPKSAAGVRTVAIPPAILGTVREHLAAGDGGESDLLLFTVVRGGDFAAATSAVLSAGLRRSLPSALPVCTSMIKPSA